MDYKTHIMRAINYIEENLKNESGFLTAPVKPVTLIITSSGYSGRRQA